jgi:hypothetical protein
MRPRLLAFVFAAALAASATGCGSDDGAGSAAGTGQSLTLTLRVEDGRGKVARATLDCGGDGGSAHGSGFLSARPEEHCADALRMQRLLTTQPPKDQVCTQLYGGPQTAHIAGTLAGDTVARDLSRTNGCEIADWKSAEPLLAPSGIRPGGP